MKDTEKAIQKKRCAAALRTIMFDRGFNMTTLSKKTGISYRSIEGYYYGRNDLAFAKAYNIIEIEHCLGIDGRILTGSKSIEDYYEDEKRKAENFTIYEPTLYPLLTPEDTQKRITELMEKYRKEFENLMNNRDDNE